ncbi:MAG: trigger factor [Lachnospiraceae bacterium]|nr:trigger factor [Lachnospiraceae bacterium]
MKQKIALLLGLVLTAASLSGCGSVVLSEMKTEKYVTLGEYKGLEVSVPSAEVTEEYRQNYINYVLSQHAQWEKITEDRAVQEGDLVNIDYEGKKDGVAFSGGTDQGFDLEIGSHTFIEGFEEGLVGARVGETRDVDATFPDPYPQNSDLAGAPVVFTVTVNEISEKRIPELTDEFVQTLGVGCDTTEEYEAYVQELLTESAQETYRRNVDEALVDAAMANCTFQEPPKAMVDQYYDRVVNRMKKVAAASGMSFETLITQYYQSTMEEFEEQAREGAAASCRESIMLQAIANKEGITVTQEEIDAALQEGAENGGYESADELKADLDTDNYEDYVMSDKVMELLRENAVITEQ